MATKNDVILAAAGGCCNRHVDLLAGIRRVWGRIVSTVDPRDPLRPYAETYDPSTMPLPAGFLPQRQVDPGVLSIRDEQLLPIPRPLLDLKRELAHGYGIIIWMDNQIGWLLKGLDGTLALRRIRSSFTPAARAFPSAPTAFSACAIRVSAYY